MCCVGVKLPCHLCSVCFWQEVMQEHLLVFRVYQSESGWVSVQESRFHPPSFLPALGGYFYTDCRRIKLVGWAEVGGLWLWLRCAVQSLWHSSEVESLYYLSQPAAYYSVSPCHHNIMANRRRWLKIKPVARWWKCAAVRRTMEETGTPTAAAWEYGPRTPECTAVMKNRFIEMWR